MIKYEGQWENALGLTSSKSNLLLWLSFTPLNPTPLRDDSRESAVLFSDLCSNLSASNCFGPRRSGVWALSWYLFADLWLTTSLFIRSVYLHAFLTKAISASVSVPNRLMATTACTTTPWNKLVLKTREEQAACFDQEQPSEQLSMIQRCDTVWHNVTRLDSMSSHILDVSDEVGTAFFYQMKVLLAHGMADSGLPTESIKGGNQTLHSKMRTRSRKIS